MKTEKKRLARLNVVKHQERDGLLRAQVVRAHHYKLQTEGERWGVMEGFR
jgi:hypothetical protein